MNDPKCTIVVPLFNKERSIRRALDSVLAQTEQDWELIVVDDGSTDAGADIVATYLADNRIRYITQSNRGPGAARNAGVRASTSDLIAFLDADDAWRPGFLARTTAILREHPDVDAVSTAWLYGAERVDSRTRLAREGVRPGKWSFDGTRQRASQLKARIDALHSSSTLVRRSAVDELGGFYERRCIHGEDGWLWGRLLFSMRTVYLLDEVLLRFHTDASDLTAGRTKPYPPPPMLTQHRQLLRGVRSEAREAVRTYLQEYGVSTLRRGLRQRSAATSIRAAWAIMLLTVGHSWRPLCGPRTI